MHRMTRDVDKTHVEAPFDGVTFRLGSDAITVVTEGTSKVMLLRRAGIGEQRFRVTKVIGGRYREDFAGRAGDPHDPDLEGPEQIMPVSYVLSTGAWRYKGYSVMVPERPGLRPGPAWASTCIACHNTLPLVTTLYDELLGAGAESYQGTLGDRLLPAGRRVGFAIGDQGVLRAALMRELAFLGTGAPSRDSTSELLARALTATRDQFDDGHLIELGVGCESCHGGAREHVIDPTRRPAFEAISPALRIERPGVPAETSVCARCHNVLFSRYPFTWEEGRRHGGRRGGSSTNSGEARDFLLGACAGEMTCSTCHDPHAEDQTAALRDLESASGNRVCLRCHGDLSSESSLEKHTHHPASSRGSACVGCHMPRKNMGLDYELTRYHRIGSPTEPRRVLGDRPLECALCHPDASVEEVVSKMEAWWPRVYDRDELRDLYGSDLSVNVLASTLRRGRPHEQAVAAATVGRHRRAWSLPLVSPLISHRYPLVRFYAKHAIERVTGIRLDVDPNQSAGELAGVAREVAPPGAASSPRKGGPSW